MGIYVNPGNESFKEAVNSSIYIDKSELIDYTNGMLKTKWKNICVSRPRRFGKSMAADMLVAYYSKGCDSKELFAERKIGQKASFGEHLNRHNVIRFDVQRFLFSQSHWDIFIDEIQTLIIGELKEVFGDCFKVNQYGLPGVLNQLYARTGEGFIFIIDEWDCVFRLARENMEVQKKYLDFLRGLFKGSEYVELAYMTGILPIKKYGEHSAINIFKELSMLNPGHIAEYFGFTEAEVKDLCGQYGVDFGETQKWYDGYLLDGLHIYNPQAVIELMDSGEFQSYWTGTETYEALKVYLDLNYDGLKEAITTMLGNGRCAVNSRKFQNDMTTFKSKDDVLTLLIHLGYLTYDKKTGEVFIPNQEIAQEFLNAADEPGWDGIIESLDRSAELLKNTWALDGEMVAKGIDAIHSATTSILRYNDENSLACVIYMAYYSASAYYMQPLAELPTGKGFADIAYLPRRNVDRPALVVELKWDQSAAGAIRQIREKQYADWIKSYTGEILLVGINYDKDTKQHQCMIERYAKE